MTVRGAFSRADGIAMEQRWWQELEDAHHIRPDDRSSWRRFPADLKAAKRDPIQARILTGTVRGVLDDLLGRGTWQPPRDWGRPLVTFPEPGIWEVPTRLWHWDNPCELHLDHPRALFVVSFIGAVAPRSGGTVILSGSPRLLIQQERRLPADERRGSIAALRDRFHRSHPWIMALTGQAASPADRKAAFTDQETTVEGVPLRVVELTGEPGDMVFCHPVMVHCVAPNRGTRRASCGSRRRSAPTRAANCAADRTVRTRPDNGRMQVAAVVFDFDGLLMDTESVMLASWQYEWRQHGLDLDVAGFWVNHGGDVTEDRYRQLAAAVGSSYDREASHARRTAYRDDLNRRLGLRPGIGAWLHDGRGAGLRLAVASSSPTTWVRSLLTRIGTDGYFAAFACGDEVAQPKPSPEVYQLALDRLGVIAGAAVAVEDSPHGVAAARAAGLRCIAIPNPHVAAGSLGSADLVLASAADLSLSRALERLPG